jgi:hypothetical protein
MRTLAALALGTAALALPTAAWAYGSDVSAYGCYLNGGQVSRPAGTEIAVRQGWIAAKRSQTLDFVRAQRTTVSVNGGSTVDLSADWTSPRQLDQGWRTDVFYPTGVVLGPGQTLSFHLVLSVKHRIFDGFTYGGPGTIVDSSCTVTGA